MRIFDHKKKKELQLSDLDLNTGRLFSDKLITTDENGDTKVEHILVFRHNGKGKRIAQIRELKEKLCNTDYHAIKVLERLIDVLVAKGLFSAEEYADMKEERQAWRDSINELEAMIEEEA